MGGSHYKMRQALALSRLPFRAWKTANTATGFTVSTAYSGTLCYRELALPIAGSRGDRRKRLLLLLFYLQHFNFCPSTAVPNFSIGNMPPFYFSVAPPKIH